MESASEMAWIRVGSIDELQKKGVIVVQGADRPISVWAQGDKFYAVDNRCPHLGFPLHKGTLKDGILTCQWHQARFDLCSGCTFDQFAGDVAGYDTRVEDGVVWVAAMPRQRADRAFHLLELDKAMRRNAVLVMAKAIVGLLHVGVTPRAVLQEIARFAAREASTTAGLTELAITGNMLPVLSEESAYYLLLRSARVIAAAASGTKRNELEPLHGRHSPEVLKRWHRQWLAAREREGIERILRATLAQCTPQHFADIHCTALNDQVYRAQGHAFDVANKQMELLDQVGWDLAPSLLPLALDQTGLGRGIEESVAWHEPIEILAPLLAAERELPALEADWSTRHGTAQAPVPALEVLLGSDPLAIIAAVRDALATSTPQAVSWQVAYAAALRLVHFASANEVGDWFNPQHTFTTANAVHQAVQRSPTAGVARAIFHVALSIYQDRFLNVPPAKLPGATAASRDAIAALPTDAATLRQNLLDAFERQANGEGASLLVSRYLRLGHPLGPLADTLALATVREDLDFHTLQVLEAGYQLARTHEGRPEAEHIFIAITRDLAAFCPTRRAQLKTAVTALKLDRGDKVYEDEPA